MHHFWPLLYFLCNESEWELELSSSTMYQKTGPCDTPNLLKPYNNVDDRILIFGSTNSLHIRYCILGRLVKQLTLPFSTRFVIITITPTFCSHTIRQKSGVLDFKGPCAAM